MGERENLFLSVTMENSQKPRTELKEKDLEREKGNIVTIIIVRESGGCCWISFVCCERRVRTAVLGKCAVEMRGGHF
jgi:hypothetical protein